GGDQAWIADACHETERRGPGRGRGLYANAPLGEELERPAMSSNVSSNVMTIPNVQAGSGTWLETLHEWVTTVDHKRLGILYIAYALVFLVVGGIEAIIIRIQLI